MVNHVFYKSTAFNTADVQRKIVETVKFRKQF